MSKELEEIKKQKEKVLKQLAEQEKKILEAQEQERLAEIKRKRQENIKKMHEANKAKKLQQQSTNVPEPVKEVPIQQSSVQEKKIELPKPEKNNIDEEPIKTKKQKIDKKYPYRVYIKDIVGSSTKKQFHFGAERFIDEDKSTVWLYNAEKKFKEIFPEDTNEYKIFHLEQVNERIVELEKLLARELKTDTEEYNIKDLKYELHLMRNRKRSLELQGRGSYLNIDEDGTPYFVFRRKGNFKLPEYDNVDIDTIYTPSETKIKKASELLDMKREKYSKHAKTFQSLLVTWFILLLLASGGMIWGFLKLNSAYEASTAAELTNNFNELVQQCEASYVKASDAVTQSGLNILNITQTVRNEVNKPDYIKNNPR